MTPQELAIALERYEGAEDYDRPRSVFREAAIKLRGLDTRLSQAHAETHAVRAELENYRCEPGTGPDPYDIIVDVRVGDMRRTSRYVAKVSTLPAFDCFNPTEADLLLKAGEKALIDVVRHFIERRR